MRETEWSGTFLEQPYVLTTVSDSGNTERIKLMLSFMKLNPMKKKDMRTGLGHNEISLLCFF